MGNFYEEIMLNLLFWIKTKHKYLSKVDELHQKDASKIVAGAWKMHKLIFLKSNYQKLLDTNLLII